MGMTMVRSRVSTSELRSNNAANKNKNDEIILPDFVLKRWGKRRHVIFLLTLIVTAAYSFWATTATLIQVPSSAGLPLSILMDSPSTTDTTTSLTSTHMTASSLRGTSISHSIPLPLPKEKVSVVLMNFSRPRMIRDSSMMRVSLLQMKLLNFLLYCHHNC